MKTKQQGFTVIELLIATTVFSVVMIICLAAFLRVGQLYYKGIYLARTQEVTRNVSDDLVNQLRLNGSATPLYPAGGTIWYFCAGTKRYSFMSNNKVDSQSESNSNFGLVRDALPSLGCVSPTKPVAMGGQPLTDQVELLGDNMRVVASLSQSDLSVTCSPAVADLACVHVHINFGDDDLLVDPVSNTSFAGSGTGYVGGVCSGPLQGSQFCATSDLDTAIKPLQ